MAAQFDDFTAEFIRRYVQATFAMPNLGTAVKQDMINYLVNLGITPAHLVPAPHQFPPVILPGPAPPAAPLAAHAVHQPKIEVPKQVSNETSSQFFHRLDAFFLLHGIVDDHRKIAFLLSAAGPPIATFVSDHITAGVTIYADIQRSVLEAFEQSFLQYLQDFLNMKKRYTETYVEFGRRLRQAYLGYLRIQESAITPPMEQLITKALIAQLMQLLPHTARLHIQNQLLINPDICWNAVLSTTDIFLSANRMTSLVGQQTHSFHPRPHQPNIRPNHQGHNHPQGPVRRHDPPSCYSCGQRGHLAPNCPRLGNPRSGN